MVSKIQCILLSAIITICLFACREENKKTTLFELMPPDKTGIDFSNKIVEDENLNILSFEYFYNGAGVGIVILIMSDNGCLIKWL